MRELFQRTLLTVDCISAQAHITAGNALFDSGDFSGALDSYSKALLALNCASDAGSSIELIGLIADCHANTGKLDVALALIQQPLNNAVGGTGACLSIPNAFLPLQERKAFYLSWAGKDDVAALEAERLVALRRSLITSDPAAVPDLARSLDHQAEILERAHRLNEAHRVSSESTGLRRRLAQQDEKYTFSYLHSLVTQAELEGMLGKHELAIRSCNEGIARLRQVQPSHSMDIEAQFHACLGQNLISTEQTKEGKASLLLAARLFQKLSRHTKGPTSFMDAYADVLIDLGRLHLDTDSASAYKYLLRATALKRRVVKFGHHPVYRSSYCESMLWLSCAMVATGRQGTECIRTALDSFEKEFNLPLTLPLTVVGITKSLLTRPDTPAISECYWSLISLVSQVTDIVDDEYLKAVEPQLDEFERLWLARFIDNDDAASMIGWMSFNHGRRLAALAESERQRQMGESFSRDERRLQDLKRQIYRLDLEISGIHVAPDVRLVQRKSVLKVGAGNTARKRTLVRDRSQLFDQYIQMRDELVANGTRIADQDPSTRHADLLSQLHKQNRAVAIWCIPALYSVARPPCLLLWQPGKTAPQLESVPEIDSISRQFIHLTSNLGSRHGRVRGGVGMRQMPPVHNDLDLIPIESAFWNQMDQLWQRIALRDFSNCSREEKCSIDLVTHGDTHNLPWLGSCPSSVDVRQFSSLNFLIRRSDAPEHAPPTPDRPLLLLCQTPDRSDPLSFLYHAEMEAEIVRLSWPGAVVEITTDTDPDLSDVAGLWIIGHGLTDQQGQPLLGLGKDRRNLDDILPISKNDSQLGFVYASTCYLGDTTDFENEPVGLSTLAALRPDGSHAAGAVAPVDDLGAMLLALQFQSHWRNGNLPRRAFDLARHSLINGYWDDDTLTIFQKACTKCLPELLNMATASSRISIQQIRSLFPDIDQSSQLAQQYLIRKQSIEFLKCWETGDDTTDISHRLVAMRGKLSDPGKAPQPIRRAIGSAKYWTWFG